MSEHVDPWRAQQVVEDAARLAEDITVLSEAEVTIWTNRVRAFSAICESTGLRTYVAVLGTMMIAKAANPRVDVFSLRPQDDSAGAFSARSVAERSLLPASRRHQFDLGTRGPQPLNNQPFFRSLRISQHMVVRESARPILNKLIALLHELARATPTEAVQALASFIHIRRRYFAVHGPTAEVNVEASAVVRQVGAKRSHIQNERTCSCFLSYARADCDFAKHLSDNLRQAGITCWQDIHDMRAGDFWREQIYDAIEKHDKLVLICSRASLERPAVVEEIQEAIARERQTGTQKLFPIRIDDFILGKQLDMLAREKVVTGEWSENWVSRVRAYHIPDFSKWSTPEAFQEEFRKLVEALNRPIGTSGTRIPARQQVL